MFERLPRQSSAAGLIVTTDNGQKQTRETFTYRVKLSRQARRPRRYPNTDNKHGDRNTGRAVPCCYLSNKHTIPLAILYGVLPILYRRRQILFLVIPTCHGVFLPVTDKISGMRKNPFLYTLLGNCLLLAVPVAPHGLYVNELNPIAKVVIFSELQYFSLLFFYNNTQIPLFVSYFRKMNKIKTKSEHYTHIRARSSIWQNREIDASGHIIRKYTNYCTKSD